MATHRVHIQMPKREVGKSDAVFIIERNDDLLATLEISKGGILYKPKGKHKGIEMRWGRFHKLITGESPENLRE